MITPGNEKNPPELWVVTHRLVMSLTALRELGQIIGSMRQPEQNAAKERANP